MLHDNGWWRIPQSVALKFVSAETLAVSLKHKKKDAKRLMTTPTPISTALWGHDIFIRDFGVKAIFSFAAGVIRGAMLTLRQHAFRLSHNLLRIIDNIRRVLLP